MKYIDLNNMYSVCMCVSVCVNIVHHYIHCLFVQL